METLTAYAVELRYDAEFWPAREEAENARDVARLVENFISGQLPPETTK